MNMYEEFDEIRPYYDEELPAVFEELIADPAFRHVLELALPGVPFDVLASRMRMCKSKLQFQVDFCYDFLKRIIREATLGVTLDNSSLADEGKAYTYVSNHRDIVLDSGFLSLMLVEKGLDTVEIAIGDNLLIYPWIKKLVRINKSFIVQRSVGMRQMLESSARLSRYMHFAINEKKENIWIAQRQGRAKDSDDRTQDALLKMLAMGGDGSPADRLRSLNIVPLAISYEFDPCDYLKAMEFQQKRDDPGFKKSREDDLVNMQTGIFGEKGHVHYQMAAPVNTWIDEVAGLPKAAFFDAVARRMDRAIHQNYRLYPNNYIAADRLDGDGRYAGRYTEADVRRFDAYIDGQLARIELPGKDEDYLRERMLTMYANPARNQAAALQ